jgi:hypothetical protein
MGTTPTNSISSKALSNFLAGVEEKMGRSIGTITSRSEKREAKREIARELNVEEVYHPNVFIAINRGEAKAHRAVENRYKRRFEEGRINEDITPSGRENIYDRINEHLIEEEK